MYVPKAIDHWRCGRADLALSTLQDAAVAYPELSHVYSTYSDALLRNAKPRPASLDKRRACVLAIHLNRQADLVALIYLLQEIRKVAEIIVLCSDVTLSNEQRCCIAPLVTHLIDQPHAEYDFGSYSRGVAWMRESQNVMSGIGDVIFCNDSILGPFSDLRKLFLIMETKRLEFWGVTVSHQIQPHVQSYFFVLSKQMISRPSVRKFFDNVRANLSKDEVILNYEIGLSKLMASLGAHALGLLCEDRLSIVTKTSAVNPMTYPASLLMLGSPFIKKRSLSSGSENCEGVEPLKRFLHCHRPALIPLVQPYWDRLTSVPID
jgi:lipopolysaccharide biosynthesis protein